MALFSHSNFRKILINALLVITLLIGDLAYNFSNILASVRDTSTNYSGNSYTWYDANYLARKSITIGHTADGAQTNYQMKLTVYQDAGSDSGAAVYLGGNCQDDFDDIRFTKSDGSTLLDFWIESYVSGTSAVVWIEFDAIPAHPDDGTFYIYYSYASAVSASDGTTTFPFFDHFDGDLSKWSGDTAYASVASSICTVTSTSGGTNRIILGNVASATNGAMRVKANLYNVATNQFSWVDFADSGSLSSHLYVCARADAAANKSWWLTQKAGAYTTVSNANLGLGNYHIIDLCRYTSGTDTVRFFIDGTQAGSDTTTNVPTVNLYAAICAATYAANLTTSADWVLQRNYTLNEPTWQAWGSEESLSVSYIPKITWW